MKAIVLGCGPAGLMAVHGLRHACGDFQRPLEVMAFSRMNKSALHGAQYLHEPIPFATPIHGRRIDYQLRGDPYSYRMKVYGRLWDGRVSPEDLHDPHPGWDIRATYDTLWSLYQKYIIHADVHPAVVGQILDQRKPDIIINSIPRDQLCHQGHTFGCTEVIAAGDAPALGIRVPFSCPDETVICNGEDNPSWYRMSRVFGHTTVEWPGAVGRVPVASAAKVRKPTYHNCDCWPELKHVGRYGRWEKGVLSHTAYNDAYNMVKEYVQAA